MKQKIDSIKQAMRFLERMDRTEYELRTKLKSKGYDDDEINKAVDFVKSYNYLNDERYTGYYIEFSKTGKSRRKITYDLKNKGIDDTLIEKAWNELEPYDESCLIKQLFLKKSRGIDTSDYQAVQKVKNYLLRQGFSISDINRVVSECLT